MEFHRFQQLPAELRLQIWECAIDESRLATHGKKRVCRIIVPQTSPESNLSKVATMKNPTIGHVCRESREVFHRRRRPNDFGDYNPTTDVVYIDEYHGWVQLGFTLLRQVHHIALSAEFCYSMMKIKDASAKKSAQLGWPYGKGSGSPINYNSDFFEHVRVCCPDLESITVVLPPLEKDMPHYADHFLLAMRPAFLRIVPYSEVQEIRITGPKAYTTYLRGFFSSKRRYLGPFIKDVNEVWKMEIDHCLDDDDPRRTVAVKAGVLEYPWGPE